MRALVAPSPGQLILDEIAQPSVSPGRVLVRSRVTAVSAGTELRMLYEGRAEHGPDPEWPAVGAFGYLAAGDIIAVGSGVTDVDEGDRIVCGRTWGAHREILDVEASHVQHLPDHLGYTEGACAYWAVPPLAGILAAQPRLYGDVAVVGLGPLGLAAVQMLVPFSRRVVAIDRVPTRCALAAGYGAIAVDASVNDAATATQQAIPGGPSVVIQAAGSQAALELSMAVVAANGTVVNVGTLPALSDFDLFWPMQLSGARIVPIYRPGGDSGADGALGTSLRQKHLPEVLDMMRRERLDIAGMCTWTLPIELAPQAMPVLRDHPESCLGLAFAWTDADVSGLDEFAEVVGGLLS